MNFKDIKVRDLVVNPSNDRHGPMGSEEAAIAWLFNNKPNEMKKLAANIADAGRVFDSPLVITDEKQILVRDGNRRVTCLKLILNPELAPVKYQDFFRALKAKVGTTLSETVNCQLETDLTTVEKIIETRHNGAQKGEGQLPWGTREKANHANRVSGKSDYAWSQRIEEYLSAEGHTDQALKIKRSTLNRLLQAKKSRERFGFDVNERGKLKSTQSQAKTTTLLLKLVDDMSNNELTLNELLKAEKRESYIDILSSKGLLPESNVPFQATTPAAKAQPKPKPHPSKVSAPTMRNTLIPKRFNYDFSWSSGQTKIHLAWEELQYQLNLEKHKLAISVLLRSMIELITKNYQDKKGIKPKDSLVKNLATINDDLLAEDKIAKDDRRDAQRIINGSISSNSIESLHRVLHSKSHIPSSDELTTMWDCLEPLLLATIKAAQEKM